MNTSIDRLQFVSAQKWQLWFVFLFGISLLVGAMSSDTVLADSSVSTRSLLIKFNKDSHYSVSDISQTFAIKSLKPVFRSTKQSGSLSLWFKADITSSDHELLSKKLQQHSAIDVVMVNRTFEVTTLPTEKTPNTLDWELPNEIDVKEFTTQNPATENKIIVAILDTGIDYTHEDLRNVMWKNEVELYGEDFVDDDNNGCVDDIYGCDMRSNVSEKLGYNPGLGGAYYSQEKYIYPDGMGHGTLVAGVVGAQQQNGIGIDGVSANVKLMSVKFINQSNIANLADAAAAIQYAVDNGAKIINNSYGKSNVDEQTLTILRDAFEYAHQNGVLMIVSAGNSGVDIDEQHSFYPANFRAENIISVNALDQDGLLWASSNFGVTSVDISAKGVAIWSTAPVGSKSLFRKYYSNSGYMQTEGTSIATPYVTGIAATIWAMYPSLTHLELKQLLLSYAEPQPELESKTRSGGIINLGNILHAIDAH